VKQEILKAGTRKSEQCFEPLSVAGKEKY